MNEDRSHLVVELAREFMQLAMRVKPSWTKAFFRYCHEGARLGSNASCVYDGVADLIDPFEHNITFNKLNDISEALFRSTGKDRAVILLVVDHKFNYDVEFEYSDMGKWMINKIDGATGIPSGIPGNSGDTILNKGRGCEEWLLNSGDTILNKGRGCEEWLWQSFLDQSPTWLCTGAPEAN